MNARSALLTAVTVLGLIAVFVGERVVGAGPPRTVLDVVGVLAVAAVTVLRWNRSALSAAAPRARVERLFAVLSTLALLALLAWFAQSDVVSAAGGPDIHQSAPRLAMVLQIVTALLGAAAVLPMVLGELAYAAMAQAPEVEVGRVQDAVGTGAALVAVLTTALALGWVADAADISFDWSYFRPGRPSDSTRGLVRGFTEPVTLSLFYPPGSEVGAAVRDYAETLAKESPLLKVERLDAAVDLARARVLGVNGNGAIAVSRGERHETYITGNVLDSSKSQLRELDPEVQKRLYKVARAPKVLYVTTGHGERAAVNSDPSDPRGTVKVFQDLLRAQNDEVRPLGAAQGLANEVPRDASAVLVLGPTTPFLREEVEALVRWARGGGRLLVALDPESGSHFDALLHPGERPGVSGPHPPAQRSLAAGDRHLWPACQRRLPGPGQRAPPGVPPRFGLARAAYPEAGGRERGLHRLHPAGDIPRPGRQLPLRRGHREAEGLGRGRRHHPSAQGERRGARGGDGRLGRPDRPRARREPGQPRARAGRRALAPR